jgi:anti-sigma regulatory factor (Ser/Thr protein kinase)
MAMKADLELSNRFHRVFVAEPEELRHIRASIRSWATARHLTSDVQGDLLIALGEATSNSVRHAFRNSPPGEIDIRLSLNDSELSVRVSDNGRWLPPSDKDDQLGAGTRIIRSVSGQFQRTHSENGTLVNFTLPITHRGRQT